MPQDQSRRINVTPTPEEEIAIERVMADASAAGYPITRLQALHRLLLAGIKATYAKPAQS